MTLTRRRLNGLTKDVNQQLSHCTEVIPGASAIPNKSINSDQHQLPAEPTKTTTIVTLLAEQLSSNVETKPITVNSKDKDHTEQQSKDMVSKQHLISLKADKEPQASITHLSDQPVTSANSKLYSNQFLSMKAALLLSAKSRWLKT